VGLGREGRRKVSKEGSIRSKHRRMLMHAQRPHRIARRRNLPHRLILSNIPELHLAVAASG